MEEKGRKRGKGVRGVERRKRGWEMGGAGGGEGGK